MKEPGPQEIENFLRAQYRLWNEDKFEEMKSIFRDIAPNGVTIQYVGQERISVQAGEFDAHHFQVVDTAGQLPQEHPPYNVWCTADDDFILLRAGAEGYMQTHYELVELNIEG